MTFEDILQQVRLQGIETFSRSSGAGGQNVNKVNSKSTLRLNIFDIQGLTELERGLLVTALGPRLIQGTILQVQAQDERSQLHNRELAQYRCALLILHALRRDKPRRPTKPSRSSQEKRVQTKKLVGLHKKNRTRPQGDY